MRKGSFRCGICMDEKLNQEAEDQGCKLLRLGKNKDYRVYALPCGHEQEVSPRNIRSGNFRCRVCISEKLDQEAQTQGCKLLGAGRNSNYRKYALPCGHEQEVQIGKIRAGIVECKTCVADKHTKEAQAYGCTLLGAGKNPRFRFYALPCGHEQEVHLSAMRIGGFECQTCEETSRTLPSNVYLLHIKVDSDEWLKLGYAKVVDSRVSGYGLPEGAEVTTVASLPFDTGNEAHAIEADIHTRYKRKRLTKKHMKDFHTISGHDECYPVTMLDTLLAELEALKSKQAS
jgi:hypothetical protein